MSVSMFEPPHHQKKTDEIRYEKPVGFRDFNTISGA